MNVSVSVFAAVPVRVRVVKVFTSDIVCPVPLSWTTLYVRPHQVKEPVPVITMVEVPTVKDNHVDATFHNVQFIVLDQSKRDLVTDHVDENEAKVIVWLFVSKVPEVCVILAVDVSVSWIV